MALLIVATLLKIVFVLTVLLTIAPVLVWAERRQSAMIQDRVGPVRAGIPLPGALAAFIRGPMSWGAKLVAYVSAGLAGLAVAALGYLLYARGELQDALRDPETRAAFIQQWREGISDYGLLLGEQGATLNANLGRLGDDPQALLAAVDASFVPVLNFYGWGAVILVLVSLFHFAAAWVVKHSVDARGHLTVFGLIHPAADAIKMIWKEDFVPPRADKLLFSAAPIIATIPAFATFAVIPFGPDLHWGDAGSPFQWLFTVVPRGAAEFGRTIPLQVANINVGILYIFAIAGTGIVGAAIAGYSSDNKYSLLGGLRAASQMVSYEVTLGLTLVGCFMVYGTLLLDEMVAWQVERGLWGFAVQPLALILFFFASIAEMKRIPFDAPEGESEIVAGYFLEYSGMKFGMFMMGEFIEHVVSSALIVTLFFGGWDLPFVHSDGIHLEFLGIPHAPLPHVVVVLLGVLAFLVKVGICCFLQLQVRWTLPRFRYDQIMQLCWKIILPLSLANIVVTGIVILLLQ